MNASSPIDRTELVENVASAPVKPRLRGVSHQYAFFVSLLCGVGLILAASDGRARVAASDLRRRGLGPARHERAVPPRDLASGAQALDEAARSLDDLRADRRDLYARGTARAEGNACERDPDRAVGRSARRRDLQARLDRRAEVAVRGGVRRARSGVGRGLRRAAERRSAGWAWRGWRSVGRCTSPAR